MEFAYTPSTAQDATELSRHTPEWARATEIVREARAMGRDKHATALAVADALRPVHDVSEIATFLMPGMGMDPDDAAAREPVEMLVSMWALASVLGDIEGTPQPLVPMMTGGVQITTHRDGDVEFPAVMAIATPLTPLTIVEEFRAAMLRTFKHPISESENSQRDSQWFNRQKAGESYRTIALSDLRSGLSPEARVQPDQYREEVAAATGKVAKAVQRYRKKWTKIVDDLSIEEPKP